VAGQLQDELERLLEPEDVSFILGCKHRPMAVLGLLSRDVEALDVPSQQKEKVDLTLSTLTDNLGKCERIFKTPIPRVYTRHTERFLAFWLLLLPTALYGATPTHGMEVPIIFLLSVFLLGIAELANQIEEPFSILPLANMCDGIEASIFEALTSSLALDEYTAAAKGDDVEPQADVEVVVATMPARSRWTPWKSDDGN